MLQIAGVFLLILATHVPGLIKADIKTIAVFGLIWSLGLGISIMVAFGMFLPVTYIFNIIFEMIMDTLGITLPEP